MQLKEVTWLAALVWLLSTVGAVSASLTVVSTERYTIHEMLTAPVCNFIITGPIEPGDDAALQTFLDTRFPNPAPDVEGWVACLSGEGGTFETGIAMGTILAQHRVATRVRAEDSCLSACAVAWLFGSLSEWDDTVNARIMDRGAHIGFHAPSLRFEADLVPGAVVQNAYAAALVSLSNFAQAAVTAPRTTGDLVLHQDLLVNMLNVGPDDFYTLDTVAQLARYDVLLPFYGWQFPPEISDPEIWLSNACGNAMLADGDPFDPVFYDGSTSLQYAMAPEPPQGWMGFNPNDYFSHACHIRFDPDTRFIQVRLFRGPNERANLFLGMYAALRYDTRIDDLPR